MSECEGVLEFDFRNHGGEEADVGDRYLEVLILGIEAPSYVVLELLRLVGMSV